MDIQVIHKATGKIEIVSEGYARNFLFPKKIARLATAQDIQNALTRGAAQQAKEAKTQQQWAEWVSRLPQADIAVQGKASPTGTLYERISTSAILSAVLAGTGIHLEESWVTHEPLKQLGSIDVQVRFPNSMTTTFHVSIKEKN